MCGDAHPRFIMTAQITARNLRMSYNSTPVLDGVSFNLQQGQSLALIGSNGAGKSTLIKCLLGMEKITEGSIHLFGEEVHNLKGQKLRLIRSRVGVVFQKHNLVPRLSVLSNVIHGALGSNTQSRLSLISGMRLWSQATASERIRTQALECLRRVRLDDMADKRADQLSGGQSQRVAIARALMQNPDLIIADEPAASLDPISGTEIMELFKSLCRESSVSLLYSTHNTSHAIEYADRLIAMKDGQISLDEDTSILDVESLRREYEHRTT